MPIIQYTENNLRNKTTSEFRTVFHSPVGVPNSQVSLYLKTPHKHHIRTSYWMTPSYTKILNLERD